jgi:putative ABC transport system permease protein
MLGIMIGVAGILALGITNQASMDSISQLFEQSSGRTDLMITSASGQNSISEGSVRKLGNIPNIELILPVVQARTQLADQVSGGGELSLSFFGVDSGGLLLQGIDPLFDPLARDYEITSGRFLQTKEAGLFETVLVEDFAEDEDLKVGDRINVVGINGIETLKIVGLIAKEGAGNNNNGTYGVVTIETAQRMFDRTNEYDQIDLMLTPDLGTDGIEEVRLAIQDRLGSEFSVTYPAGQGQRMSQMLSNYQIGLNMLSSIALFVGAFLIYNTFAMTVVERTREFGMLRTIGMTRRQIVAQVMMEALTLGILGSALGALVGVLGARGLTSLMGSLLATDITADMSIPVDTLIVSMVVGIGVTLFAALLPSFKAGRVSPIAALRIRGQSKDGFIIRFGWIPGLVMMIGSIVLLIWNPFANDPKFILGSVTIFAMFGGVALMIPASMTIWERATRPIMRLVYGNSGALGSRNIERAKSRTTLTVAALLIGVAMILVVRAMTASFSNDLIEWVGAYLGGDIYVTSNMTLRTDLARQITGTSSVKAATPIHYYNVEVQLPNKETEDLSFMSIDVPTYIQVTNLVFSDSEIDKNAVFTKLNQGGSVLVSSVLSEKYGYNQGGTIYLKTTTGLVPFEVAGVIVDFFNSGLSITGNRSDLQSYFRVDDVSTILVKVEPGVPISDAIDDLDSNYGKRYGLTLQSNESIRDGAFSLLDQAFSMFDVMGVLAVMVASLGVVNTLTMNIMERIREIGMLRAIGMTRGQVIGMVLAEASLMGVIGGIVGIIFGIVLARITLAGMMAMSGYKLDFIVPTIAIVMGLVVALVISQLAAIQPARKASRTNVLEAIRYE